MTLQTHNSAAHSVHHIVEYGHRILSTADAEEGQLQAIYERNALSSEHDAETEATSSSIRDDIAGDRKATNSGSASKQSSFKAGNDR